MDALTPVRSALRFCTSHMNTVSVPNRSPCFTHLNFRSLRLQPPSRLSTSLSHVTPQLVESPVAVGSRLHLSSAGSSDLAGRIEFVILRMNHSPSAAPHSASRRRSCSRLQAGERMPEGDFHPSVQYFILRALAGALGMPFRASMSRRDIRAYANLDKLELTPGGTAALRVWGLNSCLFRLA